MKHCFLKLDGSTAYFTDFERYVAAWLEHSMQLTEDSRHCLLPFRGGYHVILEQLRATQHDCRNTLGVIADALHLRGQPHQRTHHTQISRQRLLLDAARRDGLTLWELCLLNAGPRGHTLVIGTPQHVADVMEHWFLNGAADGFNVMPAWLPGSLTDFVDMVIPELQRRGLFRSEYEAATLRDNLGLPRPASRFHSSRSAEAAQ